MDGGKITDYLANSFAFRLCSERLRDVLESNRGKDDVVQWLETIVKRPNGTDARYWAVHFPEAANVIDLEKSTPAGPVILKAVLDPDLVTGRRLLGFPGESVRLIVAADVKRAIDVAQCTGMAFSAVPMA